MKTNVFLFISCFLFSFTKALLSLESNIINNRMYISLPFGNPEQIIKSPLNMEKSFSLFSKHLIDPNKSKTSTYFQSQIIYDNPNVLEVDEYTDGLRFTSLNIPNYNFKYFYTQTSSEEEQIIVDKQYGLSLPYKYLSSDFSLLRHLKQNKLIDKEIFTFKYDNNLNSIQILLGTFPNDLINNNSNKGICKPNKNNTTWGCNLNYVITNGFKFEINKYASFRINKNKYLFGCELHYLIIKNFFENYYRLKKCKDYIKDTNNKRYIICEQSIIQNHLKSRTIGFSFGNFIKYVNLTSMFQCDNGNKQCKSLFRCVEGNENYIFNRDFILSSITSFDHDNDVISFYNENINHLTIIYDIKHNMKEQIKIIYIIIMIILIINIFLYYGVNKIKYDNFNLGININN